MKTKAILLSAVLFLIFGCRNSNSDGEIKDTEQTDTLAPTEKLETDAIWDFQYDTITDRSNLVKSDTYNTENLGIEDIVQIINTTWPEVQIEYIRTSQDTIFIRIPNSSELTQQMGSTGAQQFLTAATYSLTELDDIKYVSFDFEEGDHAVPGVYHRGSWDN